jgi:hypothetical protein
VLDLSSIDLEEIANALGDETGYEHHWLINPDTGEIAFWTQMQSARGPLQTAAGTQQARGATR